MTRQTLLQHVHRQGGRPLGDGAQNRQGHLTHSGSVAVHGPVRRSGGGGGRGGRRRGGRRRGGGKGSTAVVGGDAQHALLN